MNCNLQTKVNLKPELFPRLTPMVKLACRPIGKTIYCNCDTTESEFYKYFVEHFEELGLECLIATGIQSNWKELTGKDDGTYGIKYYGKGKKVVWLKDKNYKKECK